MFAMLLLLLSGCAEAFDATHLGVPATMASSPDSMNVGTPFRVSNKELYALWGIANLSSPSLEKVLAGQLAGGKAIINLKIKARSRFTDVLITGLTLGLLVPRTVTFEGNIVEK
jgi:hypothetical protein